MFASAVVSQIQRVNQDWTPAQILGIIQDVVNIVLKRETDAQVYVDPATGNLPFLVTTDKTFQYSISIPGVPIWKVAHILVDYDKPVPHEGGLNLVISGPNAGGLSVAGNNKLNHDALFTDVWFGAKKYHKVPTKQIEAIGSIPASVLFLLDPTTTTDLFRIMGYQSPSQSISMSSFIPLSDSKQYTLVGIVCEIINAQDNGRFAGVYASIQGMLNELIYDTDKDTQMCFSQGYTW